jgi:uncharacterized protein
MAGMAERTPPRKPKRPRDELGRPLPWDAANRLPMEDFDELPLEENHRLGIGHWNAERFFPAHEAWEACWKQVRGEDPEEGEFFKGLSQLGAGYVHYQRGNPHGAKTLLRRGHSRIVRSVPERRGLDLEALASVVSEHADAVEAAQEAGEPMPALVFPKV